MTHESLVHVSLDGRGAVVRRRGFLKAVGLGAGAAALSFTDWMAVNAAELRKQQKAMILLWMNGGPSQLETFDPKPGHPNGGETKAIDTAVPGIRIAQGWDQMAGVMDEIALIRSMTNKRGEPPAGDLSAAHRLRPDGLGEAPVPSAPAWRRSWPTADFDLPQPGAGRRPGADPRRRGGFLGTTIRTVPGRRPDPAARQRIAGRRRAAATTAGSACSAGWRRPASAPRGRRGRPGAATTGPSTDQTAAMVRSPRMSSFDLDAEPDALRDAYGRNPFGQGCMLARRLVESGVTFVEVRSPGNWDTHFDQADRLAELIPPVDQGIAALIADLKDRGMLDSTLVVWMGEFGRTPRMNPNAGRDHFPRAFSVAVAGGGVRGGRVIGATSADGTEVVDSPVTVPDLLSSFCRSLGVDPATERMSPIGRPLKIVDGGTPVAGLFA